WAALAVGGEIHSGRRVGDAEFLRQHVALEETALAAAIFLRPGHADPALGADTLGKILGLRAFLSSPRIVRIERALGDLLGEKRARLAAQDLAGLRKADRIEGEGGHSEISLSVRRPAARDRRRRGRRPGCRARLPNSFHCRNRRAS